VLLRGPDDETVAKLALAVGSLGAVQTETFGPSRRMNIGKSLLRYLELEGTDNFKMDALPTEGCFLLGNT
jgi:hypothetical protein